MKLFVSILTLVLLCSCTPCEHEHTYEPCRDYFIKWNQAGWGAGESSHIYDYELKDNCVIIKEGEMCFNCGAITGFTTRTICGSFEIKEIHWCP